jgi:uncharacterized protein with HEPN domain
MKHEIVVYLKDISGAIESIEEFLQGVDEEFFLQSDLVRSAVERKFIIIGEALYQIAKLGFSDESKIAELQQIVGFRHRLVHGYRMIDGRRVYAAAKDGMLTLKASVNGLLNDTK